MLTIIECKRDVAAENEQYYIFAMVDSIHTYLMIKNGIPPGGRLPRKVLIWWIISSVSIC